MTTLEQMTAELAEQEPDAFYTLVDSLCVGRKLDYFSREKRPGWEQFGNDVAKFGGAA